MYKDIIFDQAEYIARLQSVKQEMAKRQIDVLLLSEPPNQHYLTGYNAYSFYTPQMVIIGLSHPEPIWVGRFMDSVSARRTTYLADDNIRAYADKYVQSATHNPCDYYAEIVRDLAGEKARVGVEMGGYYYYAKTHADLVKALPNAEFVDADLLVNWIRIVKSKAELAVMRQAGAIADAMMYRAIEAMEPGTRECDVVAAVYSQMMAGTPEFGGSFTCSPPFLCVGDRINEPHPIWTDRPIPASTHINLELFGVRHRYQVNLSRSICVGEPSAAYRKLADIAIEALNAGLDSVRPGQVCEEVSLAFSSALAKHGLEKEARLGYSIGVGYPPAVGERTASLRKGDRTELEEGMTFHMMPGLWLDDVGVAITQSFAVTSTGYEPLTAIPRQLFIK